MKASVLLYADETYVINRCMCDASEIVIHDANGKGGKDKGLRTARRRRRHVRGDAESLSSFAMSQKSFQVVAPKAQYNLSTHGLPPASRQISSQNAAESRQK